MGAGAAALVLDAARGGGRRRTAVVFADGAVFDGGIAPTTGPTKFSTTHQLFGP